MTQDGPRVFAPPVLCGRCGGVAALVRRWSPDPDRVAAVPTCVDCWARVIVTKRRLDTQATHSSEGES